MSFEIKVNPDAVRKLAEEARKVPEDRIDKSIEKLENLENTLESWKGDGKPAHDEACADLKETLIDAKNLMNSILAALNHAIDDFSDIDQEIGTKFERVVNNYMSD